MNEDKANSSLAKACEAINERLGGPYINVGALGIILASRGLEIRSIADEVNCGAHLPGFWRPYE